MTKPKYLSNPEIDIDAQLRALCDDDDDLRIFIHGRAADEELNGPRHERLAAIEESQTRGQKKPRMGGS